MEECRRPESLLPVPAGTGRGGDTVLPAVPWASAAFLAQQIAQERVGKGLHIEPLREAVVAYARAAGLSRVPAPSGDKARKRRSERTVEESGRYSPSP